MLNTEMLADDPWAEPALKDYEIVRIARRLEKLRMRWMDIVNELPSDAVEALDNDNLYPIAMPEHVIHRCLSKPDKWECGDFGIRRKPVLDQG